MAANGNHGTPALWDRFVDSAACHIAVMLAASASVCLASVLQPLVGLGIYVALLTLTTLELLRLSRARRRGVALGYIVTTVVVSVVSFASIYQWGGSGKWVRFPDEEKCFADALYLSAITWTSLGTAEFQAVGMGRFFVAMQSIASHAWFAFVVGMVVADVAAKPENGTS